MCSGTVDGSELRLYNHRVDGAKNPGKSWDNSTTVPSSRFSTGFLNHHQHDMLRNSSTRSSCNLSSNPVAVVRITFSRQSVRKSRRSTKKDVEFVYEFGNSCLFLVLNSPIIYKFLVSLVFVMLFWTLFFSIAVSQTGLLLVEGVDWNW